MPVKVTRCVCWCYIGILLHVNFPHEQFILVDFDFSWLCYEHLYYLCIYSNIFTIWLTHNYKLNLNFWEGKTTFLSSWLRLLPYCYISSQQLNFFCTCDDDDNDNADAMPMLSWLTDMTFTCNYVGVKSTTSESVSCLVHGYFSHGMDYSTF